jgi:enoyl-CoA hydratase/carnithine racemase
VLAEPAEGTYGMAAMDTELSAEEALRMIIAQRAAQNTEALQAILDMVPEAARPALLRALEVASIGYANALNQLP